MSLKGAAAKMPPVNMPENGGSGPPSRTPSIMDSPTLARVERARLRQEAGSSQREDSLERALLDPKVRFVTFVNLP